MCTLMSVRARIRYVHVHFCDRFSECMRDNYDISLYGIRVDTPELNDVLMLCIKRTLLCVYCTT